MLADQLKLNLTSQRNEAVESLVNGNLTDLASARYLQGHIHSIDQILLLIKQLEGTEDDE